MSDISPVTPVWISNNNTSDKKVNGVDKVTNNLTKRLESTDIDNSQPTISGIDDPSEFDLQHLDAFVNKVGLKTSWEQSFICPCVNPKTLAPNPKCPICHGEGRGYLPAKDTLVAIQENDKGYAQYQAGYFDSGSAIGTVGRNSKVSAWDRITVPDAQVRQQYMFNVTDDRVADGHQIPYDVHSIIFASYMKDGILQQAMEGSEYTFDREHDKIIPNSSLIGYNLSLILSVTLRYIVVNVLKELRYQYTKRNNTSGRYTELPRKLLLKREEVFHNNIPMVNTGNGEESTKPVVSQMDIISRSANKDTDKGFGF